MIVASQIVEAEPDSLATEWNWRQNIQEKSDRKLFPQGGDIRTIELKDRRTEETLLLSFIRKNLSMEWIWRHC